MIEQQTNSLDALFERCRQFQISLTYLYEENERLRRTAKWAIISEIVILLLLGATLWRQF